MAKGKRSFASKEKKIIIFNEEDRKDYLLGFSKRKKMRRQKALHDLKMKEKEKIKELKKKKKDELLEQLRKQREELDALDSGGEEEEQQQPEEEMSPVNATYDHPGHIVTVTTVCTVDLEEGSTTIGYNKGYSEEQTFTDKIKVNEKNAKNKQFEKKTKKYCKNNKFKRKKSRDNNSSKLHPRKKWKK